MRLEAAYLGRGSCLREVQCVLPTPTLPFLPTVHFMLRPWSRSTGPCSSAAPPSSLLLELSPSGTPGLRYAWSINMPYFVVIFTTCHKGLPSKLLCAAVVKFVCNVSCNQQCRVFLKSL